MNDIALVLYPEVMFRKGGQIHNWADKVTAHFTRLAIQEAPERTGAMKASIYGNVDQVGPEQLDMTVSVGVDYALYVLEGTEGGMVGPRRLYNAGMTIQGTGRRSPVSSSGKALVPSYMFRTGGPEKEWFINGQNANPFLLRAFHRTAGRYRSIGSMTTR